METAVLSAESCVRNEVGETAVSLLARFVKAIYSTNIIHHRRHHEWSNPPPRMNRLRFVKS